MRDELGQWIAKCNNNITKQEKQAHNILLECGVPEHELRQLWVEQRAAQLSLRARKSVL